MLQQFDLIPTKNRQSEAFEFHTPPGEFRLLSAANPGASCFSSYGCFLRKVSPPPTEVSIRFACSNTFDQAPTRYRVYAHTYRGSTLTVCRDWPIVEKPRSTNPALTYTNLLPEWNDYWADPANVAALETFFSVEVSGNGYLYMARLAIVTP